jgi:multicomponent K+:H+ antiporter subunit G
MSMAAACLALAGAIVALVGSVGLLRLRTFYERVHPATLVSTLGASLVLCGSSLFFFAGQGRFPAQEIAIAIFVLATTPVTYMFLARAALQRDPAQRTEVP